MSRHLCLSGVCRLRPAGHSGREKESLSREVTTQTAVNEVRLGLGGPLETRWPCYIWNGGDMEDSDQGTKRHQLTDNLTELLSCSQLCPSFLPSPAGQGVPQHGQDLAKAS